MKKAIYLNIILTFSFILFSCVGTYQEEGGEPASTSDAFPPDNYNPIFIKSIRNFDYDKDSTANTEISSVDTRNMNLVKIKILILY